MIDTNLKPIVIDGRTIYYKIGWDVSEYGDSVWTDFYMTNDKTKWRKKFYLFGPKIEVLDNKIAFKLHGESIESSNRTKVDNLKFLRRKLELQNRKEEIERGEIV